MNRFTYIYDTWCGWCYGAGPVIRTLIGSGAEVTVMHRYLFQGAQAHRMGDGFGAQAWGYDQCISSLTGQVFSETYCQNILQNPDEVLESGLTAQAAALVHNQGAVAEMQLASALQKLRYVDGVSAADADAVQKVLGQFGIATPLQDATAPAREISEKASKITRLSGMQGVPVLLQHRGIRTRQVDLSSFYQTPGKILAFVA